MDTHHGGGTGVLHSALLHWMVMGAIGKLQGVGRFFISTLRAVPEKQICAALLCARPRTLQPRALSLATPMAL